MNFFRTSRDLEIREISALLMKISDSIDFINDAVEKRSKSISPHLNSMEKSNHVVELNAITPSFRELASLKLLCVLSRKLDYNQLPNNPKYLTRMSVMLADNLIEQLNAPK